MMNAVPFAAARAVTSIKSKTVSSLANQDVSVQQEKCYIKTNVYHFTTARFNDAGDVVEN